MFFESFYFWDYKSDFPWYIGSLLQVCGLFLIWCATYAEKYLNTNWRIYMAFSFFVRSLGAILIVWAWLELFSIDYKYPPLEIADAVIFWVVVFAVISALLYDKILRRYLLIAAVFSMFAIKISRNIPTTIPALALFILSLFYFLKSISALGFRRSIFFTKPTDKLVTDSCFSFRRHPQFLAATMLLFSSIITMAPNYGPEILNFLAINFFVFASALYLVARSEENNLVSRYEEKYIAYKQTASFIVGAGNNIKKENIRNKIFHVAAAYALSIGLLQVMYYGYDISFYLSNIPLSNAYREEINEAKANLRSISEAEWKYYAKNKKWGKTFDEIGWKPKGKTQFTYFLNSCDEAIASSEGFSKCDRFVESRFKWFRDEDTITEKGFYAAAVLHKNKAYNSYIISVWTIDKAGRPFCLSKYLHDIFSRLD